MNKVKFIRVKTMFLAIAPVLLMFTHCWAASYYVESANVSDSNDGKSAWHPAESGAVKVNQPLWRTTASHQHPGKGE